jgi:hypothetical protein
LRSPIRCTLFKTNSHKSRCRNPCRSADLPRASEPTGASRGTSTLHLERFLYDASADGIKKISKPIQFAPELEIPLGTIFSYVSPCYLRPIILHDSVGPEIMVPISRKICGTSALQALWGALLPRRVRKRWSHMVDVLHPNGYNGGGEAWLHIDDKAVSTVRHEDVFGGHENEQVLIYCRSAPTRT